MIREPEASIEGFAASTVVREGGQVTGFGDVIIASSPDAPGTLLVCVILDLHLDWEPATLEVAPVSTELTMASDFDVLLEQDAPLHYPAMVEVWNHGTLTAPQVNERLGPLQANARSAIDSLYRALLDNGSTSEDVTMRGVPIDSDNDPRAGFQEAEAERARSFWKPAARLYSEPAQAAERASTATVGRLLATGLQRAAWDVPQYAAHVGLSVGDLTALCEDSFEPSKLQPELIGKALAAVAADEDEFEAALRRTIRVDQFVDFEGSSTSSHSMALPRAAGPAKRGRTRAIAKVPRDPSAEFERYIQRAIRAFRRAVRK
jgi:hypothetical protein